MPSCLCSRSLPSSSYELAHSLFRDSSKYIEEWSKELNIFFYFIFLSLLRVERPSSFFLWWTAKDAAALKIIHSIVLVMFFVILLCVVFCFSRKKKYIKHPMPLSRDELCILNFYTLESRAEALETSSSTNEQRTSWNIY